VNNKIYASLEIGSSEARILVCHIRENRVYVLSRQSVETEGFESGQVGDANALVQKLKALKVHVEADLNQALQSVTLSIPSVDVTMENLSVSQELETDESIDPKQVKKLFREAMNKPAPAEMISVNLLPRGFIIDGERAFIDPAGQKGQLVQMDAQRAIAPAALVYELISAVELAGFRVRDILVGSTAEALHSLSYSKSGANVCHVNIGKTTTTITLAHNGKIHSTKALSIGGMDADLGLQKTLDIDTVTAKTLKHHFGSLAGSLNPHEFIHVAETQNGFSSITRGMVENVLRARYEMILKVVKQYLYENAIRTDLLEYIFSGGASEIEGLAGFAQEFFGAGVAVQRPGMLGIRSSKYAQLAGLAVFSHELGLITGQNHDIIDFTQYTTAKGNQLKEGSPQVANPVQGSSFMDRKMENSGVLVRLFDMIFDEKEAQ